MRFRRSRTFLGVALTGACASLLLAGAAAGSDSSSAPATAAPSCGARISKSITLSADIGPCAPTTDGLDIVANGVTVNLNNHSIIGTDNTNATKQEQAGIKFVNVHNSAVQGPGEITHFDAGVDISGGGGNTVNGVTADANIAHVLLTGGVNPSNPEATPCNLGDGITTDGSSGNLISNDAATNNGPYSGISLVNASTHNTVLDNNSYDNDVPNTIVGTPPPGTPGPCGPFGASKVGQGRPHQDIGIRIEGPGATNNVLEGNRSTGNELEGISIHGNVCPKSGPQVPQGTPPNTDNLVENNYVASNGFADNTDGIGILQQGPTGVVCVAYNNTIAGNTSNSNAHDGVYVGGRGASGNVIRDNTTDTNGNDGVELAGGGFSSNLGTALPGATHDTVSGNTADSNHKNGIALDGPTGTGATAAPGAIDNTVSGNEGNSNTMWDGFDGNPACDANTWTGDSFGKVNQACVL